MPCAVLCCETPGYHSIAQRYFEEKGFKHVALLTADGALEAAPAMGCADIILDLVSTGDSLHREGLCMCVCMCVCLQMGEALAWCKTPH